MNRPLNLVMLTIASAILGLPPAQAIIKLDPQMVVDLTVTRNTRAKGVELTAQRSYLVLQRALGEFDFNLKFTPSFEYSEAEVLAGTTNLIDRTTSLSAELAKKLRSGTSLGFAYINVLQNSTVPAASTRTANRALDSLQVSVRQPVWQNAFGYADRLSLEIARASVQSALESREENLEGIILDSMTLFWNSYIAERQLKENIAAREKYEQLVKNVRRKAGFNLSTPGELPRLEAELKATDQKVKASSSSYLNSLTSLLTAIGMEAGLETKETIELVVPVELPPVPVLQAKALDNLRLMRIARSNLDSASKNQDLVRSENRPRLDVVARAKSTGVDETNGPALAEMQSGSKPTYYLGLEFEAPLDSDLKRGLVADAEIARRQVENDLLATSLQVRDQIVTLERQVASQFAVAQSAIDAVELRARVVRELEAAFRQGRQPLVELIRAYNELFNAQLDRARSIGQYHISLNELAGARDELVSNIKR